MAAQTTTTDLSMKLFIDTKSQRVLFAEAGKDVVDLLFSLLHLPLATAVALVGPAFVAGSAGSLCCSAEFEACFRPSAYAQPIAAKDPSLSSTSPAANLFLMPASSFEPSRIFFRCKSNYAGYGNPGIRIQHCCLYMTDVEGTRCPNCGDPMRSRLQHVSSVDSPARSARSGPTFSSSPAAGADGSHLIKQAPSSPPPPRIFFRCVHQYSDCRVRGGCRNCNSFMADVKGTACPNCKNPMTETLYYVSPAWSGHSNNPTEKPQSSSGGGGSVQDQEAAATATYKVLDNLDIKRNDPTSAISGRMGITDLGSLEERTVRVNYIKGLQILKTLLHSKTVLTDVFIFKAGA